MTRKEAARAWWGFCGRCDPPEKKRKPLKGKPSGSKVRIVAEPAEEMIGLHTGCEDPCLDIEGPDGRTLREEMEGGK